MKFSTLVGRPEVIISINFGENSYKILRVIIDHLRKTRTIFRHAYRVKLRIPASIRQTTWRNQLKIAVSIEYPSYRALPKRKKRIGSKFSEL